MNSTERKFDVIILGAGAAGLMCAIEAGKRGRSVAVIERSESVGKKILISGGGRCNFTNLFCKPENFISANPHFCKSALARYTPKDFIALVEKHGIAYHEKTLGQLFCDGSAREIVDMLLQECDAANVRIFLNAEKVSVERDINSETQSVERGSNAEKSSAERHMSVKDQRAFSVTVAGETFRAPSLVVATGGLSIPKMGATSFGYDLAKRFRLDIEEPYPALVPLTFNADDLKNYADLAGISLEVVASVDTKKGTRQGTEQGTEQDNKKGKQKFREKMLFTHRGLSGPAILQISSYWEPGAAGQTKHRSTRRRSTGTGGDPP